MGGKPNSSWTGLAPDQQFLSTPYHFRKAEMTSDIKGYTLRSTGLTKKFHAKDDLLQFQGRVWKHLCDHGLQDPTNPDQVLDIVNNYPHFMANMKLTEELCDSFRKKFDEFDMSNDSAAKAFFLNSLDDKVATSLERRGKTSDGFVMTWIRLILLILPPSLDRFDILKDKIKSTNLENYAGQNVRELIDQYIDWATNLKAAG